MQKVSVIEKNGAYELSLKPTYSNRLKQLLIVVAGSALAIHASAASSIDATGLTGEIEGAKDTVLGLFGVALVVLGVFAGWRYLKRGANSA
ncbi:major capsid protein [Acinetobacter baumannii]|uniref:major capsid protein n=1 Tax=Acinetobacter baumannii TaxID=470 RepID=UPI002341298B|nr:major capsid protein [Acinetobacter baumannii]